MQQGQLVDLSVVIAVSAAKIGYEMKLPLADAAIVATARLYKATIWTQDSDLQNVEGVKFVKKR
jgi:predicted nucleic acid-binding protein